MKLFTGEVERNVKYKRGVMMRKKKNKKIGVNQRVVTVKDVKMLKLMR